MTSKMLCLDECSRFSLRCSCQVVEINSLLSRNPCIWLKLDVSEGKQNVAAHGVHIELLSFKVLLLFVDFGMLELKWRTSSRRSRIALIVGDTVTV